MKTLQDYINDLKEQEQTTLIDDLNITSEEIIDRFIDRIEDCFDELEQDNEEETENQDI
jgi:hypothetical protein